MSDLYKDVISSFRLAAEALEDIPDLQASLSQKEAALAEAIDTNETLRAAIHGLQASIDDLKSQVRSLEVERDDAGFRELEAQDKLQTLLRTLGAVAGIVNTTVAEHTPKPEVVEPNAAAEVAPEAQGAGSISKESFDAMYKQLEVSNELLEDMAPKPSGLPLTKWRDDIGDVSNAFIDEAIKAAQPSGLPHDEAAPSPTPSDGPVDEWHAPKIEELTQPLPWLNIPAMDKPDSVSWKDFVSGGGRRPFWVTDEMMELGSSTSAA